MWYYLSTFFRFDSSVAFLSIVCLLYSRHWRYTFISRPVQNSKLESSLHIYIFISNQDYWYRLMVSSWGQSTSRIDITIECRTIFITFCVLTFYGVFNLYGYNEMPSWFIYLYFLWFKKLESYTTLGFFFGEKLLNCHAKIYFQLNATQRFFSTKPL